MFAAAVARNPDGDIIRYFDGRITLRELDELSDAFAAGILDAGFAAGERVAHLPAERAPVRDRADRHLEGRRHRGVDQPDEPGARAASSCCRTPGRPCWSACRACTGTSRAKVRGRTRAVRTVITTSELEYQTRADPRIFGGVERIACAGTLDMAELLERFRGQAPAAGVARPGRRGLPDLHLGHHRSAQGRDDHAPQRGVQRPGLPGLDRPRPATTWCSGWRRCSTSPG